MILWLKGREQNYSIYCVAQGFSHGRRIGSQLNVVGTRAFNIYGGCVFLLKELNMLFKKKSNIG